MQYKSPLHIIPREYHDDLSGGTLKKVKKKLLLRFDLEGGTTIEIGDRQYDKNELISAFDDLGTHPEYHLKLFKTNYLIKFIEEGELALFNWKNDQLEWLNKEGVGDGYKDWLLPIFCDQLSKLYVKHVEVCNYSSLKKLKKLQSLNLQISEYYNNQIFAKVYDVLKNRNDVIVDTFENPLKAGSVVSLKEGIEAQVDFRYIDVYEYLPDSFVGLREDYRRWCQQVVYLFLTKEGSLSRISSKDLVVLEEAAKVAGIDGQGNYNEIVQAIQLELRNRNTTGQAGNVGNYYNKRDLRRFEKRNQEPSDWGVGGRLVAYVGMMVFMMAILKTCDSGSSKSKSRYDNFPSYNSWERKQPDYLKEINKIDFDEIFKAHGYQEKIDKINWDFNQQPDLKLDMDAIIKEYKENGNFNNLVRPGAGSMEVLPKPKPKVVPKLQNEKEFRIDINDVPTIEKQQRQGN